MKSFYEKLLVEEIDFPCNIIVVPSVLRKMCFFTWLATRGLF